jgi:membrane protein DedA with SNARE-associated domain
MDIDILQLIEEWGSLFYVVSFVWAFLEGETFVIFAGAAVQQGLLNYTLLVVTAWAGSFAGDQLYFYIGRRWGVSLLHRFPGWRPGVEAALAWLRKYNTLFVLSFRFIYGVRNFSSFAMGMSGLPWPRFFVLNLIAAGLWANTFAIAGYVLGSVFEAALGDVAKDFGLVMLGVFGTIIGVALLSRWRRKRKGAVPAPPDRPGPPG